MIVVDIKRAAEIHRNRIRLARGPLLANLDQEFMRALEAGDAAAIDRIKAEKQRLRDAPADKRIDLAKTIEELRAVWIN